MTKYIMYKRPRELFGNTQRVVLGEENIYITINSDEEGPVEIFCSVGKAGNDKQGEAVAICQLSTYLLQGPHERDEAVAILIHVLRGIEGQLNGFNRGMNIKSIPDAIGWALQGYPDREGNKLVVDDGNDEI